MNTASRAYALDSSLPQTADGFFSSSLFVRDESSPLSEARLREHLDAVRARLVDRIGDLSARQEPPSRRQERELRFLLDELVEALHRLSSFSGGR